jgi:hypothetical protein
LEDGVYYAVMWISETLRKVPEFAAKLIQVDGIYEIFLQTLEHTKGVGLKILEYILLPSDSANPGKFDAAQLVRVAAARGAIPWLARTLVGGKTTELEKATFKKMTATAKTQVFLVLLKAEEKGRSFKKWDWSHGLMLATRQSRRRTAWMHSSQRR